MTNGDSVRCYCPVKVVSSKTLTQVIKILSLLEDSVNVQEIHSFTVCVFTLFVVSQHKFVALLNFATESSMNSK